MNPEIKKLISEFQLQKISRDELISRLPFSKSQSPEIIRQIFADIVASKRADDLYYFPTLQWLFEENDEFIDIQHRLLQETWHDRYEEIAHDLQHRKNPKSIPFLKEAMQKKFDFLESYGTGTRQFISQSGHALQSIGTKEAIDVIRELSHSDDPVLRDEMLYRLSRIEKRNDYEKNYDL